MKTLTLTILVLSCIHLRGQGKGPAAYGFRHINTTYNGDPVEILVKSKKGEENISKPLFLFCQGSLPVPLIIRYSNEGKQGIYNVFVFNPDSLSRDFHLVIIGKPYVPLIMDDKSLGGDMSYRDSSGGFPRKYVERNLLDYYVARNIAVLRFLNGQSWVAKNKLVIAGHSEGSAVAARIAVEYPPVTQLIYSGGNPLGRIVTLISRARAGETDASKNTEDVFQLWKNIVAEPQNTDSGEDTFRGTYQFSFPPPMSYLQKLKIPVFVTYGTKDYGLVSAADYFRLEMIRLKKDNFTFKAYQGLDHDFFPVKENGEIDFNVFNWDNVAEDWRSWLRSAK